MKTPEAGKPTKGPADHLSDVELLRAEQLAVQGTLEDLIIGYRDGVIDGETYYKLVEGLQDQLTGLQMMIDDTNRKANQALGTTRSGQRLSREAILNATRRFFTP